jgi:DNA-binding XRE family transcriptional regulator
MPIRRDPIEEATRRARQQVERALADLRDARRNAGISQATMAALLGCSRQLIGAIEAGELEDVGCLQLARMGAVVGLDIPIRAFPGGSPLRDAAQLRLLARLRLIIGGAWSWGTEVPVSANPLDRRAVDAVLMRMPHRVGVEAVSRMLDSQAQTRQILLKQEAAGLDRMVLLLADTRHNRSALVDGAQTLGPAFPLRHRDVMRELRAGRLPSANGIVLV